MDIQTVLLKDYSSLRVGGVGKLIVVKNEEELRGAVQYARRTNLRPHVIGGGTNSYFGNDLSTYLFIYPRLTGIEVTEEEKGATLTAYASEVWDQVVELAVKKGLWGIENLSYIPGTVGGAPVQNIGAYGAELKESFVSLKAYDTKEDTIKILNKEECRFGYRDSLFKHESGRYIILSVTMRLSKTPAPKLNYKPLDTLADNPAITLQEIRDTVIAVRTQKLPDYKEYPNAGSFFKNPIITHELSSLLKDNYPGLPRIATENDIKVPAAWLIEHVAKMKGERNGDIGTWPKQPLVIVNYGHATADEIDQFANDIRAKIHEETGISIEQEVNRIG